MAAATTLPLDVVFGILTHLPVKALSRFRCVSQSWSALISSPSFIKSHHQRSKQTPLLFIINTELENKHGRHPKYTLIQDSKARYLQLAFSCLDLVCLYDQYDIYIQNPATNEGITLTKTSSQYARRYCVCRKVAFAYLPSTSEYKVFQTYMVSGLDTMVCEVFTLGTAQWRVIGGPPPFTVRCSNMPIVAETIHFLPAWIDMQHDDKSNGLARFDLRKEEWSTQLLPLPRYFFNAVGDNSAIIQLKEMRGMLSLARMGETKMGLWLLKDYDKGVWVKEYNINVPEFSVPLRIEEDGRVLLRMRGRKLQLYDQRNGEFEVIYDGSYTLRVSFFVESFMSLDDESFRSLKSM